MPILLWSPPNRKWQDRRVSQMRFASTYFSSILRRLTVPRDLFTSFPTECVRERNCIPIAYDDERNIATLAMDFSDREAAEFYRFVANRDVETVFADRAAILDLLQRSVTA